MPEQHIDACPNCLARGNEPTRITRVPNGIQCEYRCRVCRSTWTTSYWGEDD